MQVDIQHSVLRCLATFGILALVSTGLDAQQTTGTIRGTVTDASGGAVVGATVTATNTETGAADKSQTDVGGTYSFPLRPPGHYTVKAQSPGFGAVVHEDILVRITETAVVN